MSELLRETINAAERAVAGEDSRVENYLERLLSSPGELRSGEDSQRVYLAALLDFLGMHEESARVLREAPGAMSLNMEGILAAAHGQEGQARDILLQALAQSRRFPLSRKQILAKRRSSLSRKQILANLAAVSLQAGFVGEAEARVEEAARARRGASPATDVLIATIRAGIAARQGDLSALRDAAASLKEASKARLAELGADHPQALAVVANMASADIMLARADNSAVRLERAIHVLEVAAFRLAAELGVDHPQARAAMASLAAARTEPAPEQPPGPESGAGEARAAWPLPDIDRVARVPSWGMRPRAATPPRETSASPPAPTPTLSLVGADLSAEFLAVIQERLGPNAAELLYVAKEHCAVVIPDPGDNAMRLVHQIQEAMRAYAPSARIEVVYHKWEFRPYLLSSLTVYGPDTTPYLAESVPATTLAGEIAAALVQQVPGLANSRGGRIGTVIDAETEEGPTRLDPDKTLHENRVKDKSRLRVGAKAIAGSPSPEMPASRLTGQEPGDARQ